MIRIVRRTDTRMHGTSDDDDGLRMADLAAKEYSGDLNTPSDDEDIERQDGTRLLAQEQQPTPSRSRPVAYLDGLRGFAAFLVYISHHVSWFYGSDVPIQHGYGWHGEKLFATLPFIRPFFTGGSAAVAIFFVLSGYVLSRSSLRQLRDGQRGSCYDSLISATIRRPFRLFIPPAGVSLVMVFVMQLPFGLAPRLSWPVAKDNIFKELGAWVYELVLALNPFVSRGILSRWFPYNPPIWTMPVEFQGSIVVFFLIAVSSRIKPNYRPTFFLITGILLLLFYQWALACFLFGVVLSINDMEELDEALFLYRLSPRVKLIMFHIMLLFAWFLFGQVAGAGNTPEHSYNSFGWYYLTQLIPPNYYNGEYWRWYNTIGGILCVYAVTKLRWLQKFLTLPTFRYLGKISFSLYLTHIPFLWVIGDTIYRLFGLTRPELQTWADNRIHIPDVGPVGLSTRWVISQLFILPLNMLFAELGTVVFDEPSIWVGKLIVEKLRAGGWV